MRAQVRLLSKGYARRTQKFKAVREAAATALSQRFGHYLRARGHQGSINVRYTEGRMIFKWVLSTAPVLGEGGGHAVGGGGAGGAATVLWGLGAGCMPRQGTAAGLATPRLAWGAPCSWQAMWFVPCCAVHRCSVVALPRDASPPNLPSAGCSWLLLCRCSVGINGKPPTIDMKTLSGGERSLTTLAFVLALGQTSINPPFHALDEFGEASPWGRAGLTRAGSGTGRQGRCRGAGQRGCEPAAQLPGRPSPCGLRENPCCSSLAVGGDA